MNQNSVHPNLYTSQRESTRNNYSLTSLEIVIDGLTESDIISAMRAGIRSVINSNTKDINSISAGNYGGKLGPYLFWLKKIMS